MVFLHILCVVAGLLLTVFFGFALTFGKFTALDDIFGGVMCICLFPLLGGFGGLSLYVNRKIFIRVDERSVSAFCQYGLSLNCQMTDIENVSYGGTELHIQLQNGKKYRLMHLQNAYEIGQYIYQHIPHKSVETLNQEKLRSQIQTLRKKRNFSGISSLVCFLLIFVEIIITAALTDWKEMDDFGSADWSVFTVMAVIFVMTFTASALLLRKWVVYCEKHTQATEALNKAILYTSPLEPGNAIQLFVNDERYPVLRVAVYGYPHSKEVYHTVEVILKDATLHCVHRSEIFPDYETLYVTAELEYFTEIPLPSAEV